MKQRTAQFLAQKQGSILQVILSLIVGLFICILFTVYLVARHANPIFLDENGKPVNAQSTESPAKSY